MTIRYSNEKLLGIPIPDDGVSFGQISANNITTLVEINNVVVSGSYSFETVTITLKGITNPPIPKPTPTSFGSSSFSFRGRTWKVIDTQQGAKFRIADVEKYSSWSVTGVDLDNPVIKI
jgi:hypothetical protein